MESSRAAFFKIILDLCFLKLRPRRERELTQEVDVSRNLKEEEFCQTKKGFLCREKWTREVYRPEPVGSGGLPGCILVGSKAQGEVALGGQGCLAFTKIPVPEAWHRNRRSLK